MRGSNVAAPRRANFTKKLSTSSFHRTKHPETVNSSPHGCIFFFFAEFTFVYLDFYTGTSYDGRVVYKVLYADVSNEQSRELIILW